jgi:16S rRNA (guanine1516-N2)-methyltransferase
VSRFFLSRSSGRLCLTSRSSERSPLYVDFTTPALMQRVKRLSPRSELLLKAIGGQPGETVVDMTTGLGTDSFLLAAYGYRVFSIERSRTLYLL